MSTALKLEVTGLIAFQILIAILLPHVLTNLGVGAKHRMLIVASVAICVIGLLLLFANEAIQ